MKRVIVCGGREFADRDAVFDVLISLPFFLASPRRQITVVHGAARGADSLAADVAEEIGYPVEAHPADWKNHGNSAGPRRNIAMLKAGADLVIAFPGGRGTAHMAAIAVEAGVAVLEYTPGKGGAK